MTEILELKQPCKGDTVCRGPDWIWGSQDHDKTGKPVQGEVTEVDVPKGWFIVKWANGREYCYYWGRTKSKGEVLAPDDNGQPYFRGIICCLPEPKEEPKPEPEKANKEEAKTYKWPALKIGDRVHRGPDWEWREQDLDSKTKKRMTGIYEEDGATGWKRVRWEDGSINNYRYGQEGNKHDIKIAIKPEKGDKVIVLPGCSAEASVDKKYDLQEGEVVGARGVSLRIKFADGKTWNFDTKHVDYAEHKEETVQEQEDESKPKRFKVGDRVIISPYQDTIEAALPSNLGVLKEDDESDLDGMDEDALPYLVGLTDEEGNEIGETFWFKASDLLDPEEQANPAKPTTKKSSKTTTTTDSKTESTTEEPTMAQTLASKTTKHVAEIINHGEKLILPTKMTLEGAIDLLQRRIKYLEEETVFAETFDVFPFDGAHAFSEVLTKKYGWAPAEATPGMFGPRPPALITIDTGIGTKKQVPWGSFSIPGVEGLLTMGVNWVGKRLGFSINAKIKRKHEDTVRSLFEDMRTFLKDGSIYKGKAIRIRFTDDDGEAIAMPEPAFIDTSDVNEGMLIYPDAVAHAIRTNLFTPIERHEDLIANKIPIKRGVLLGGTYGTGKTMAAKVAGKKAVENGITYLYIPRASDLATAIEFAKQYQSPACVIFCEDIDRVMAGDRSVEMDDILNIIDGIDTKTCNIVVVLTTNDLNAINPAMLRPGRLDAVIEVTAPDARAIERLLRVYGGKAIDPGTDLTNVSQILDGCIPAVITEVVSRAKLAQLHLQAPGELVTSLTEEALIEAASTMKGQLDILKRATEKPRQTPDFSVAFAEMITDGAKKAIREDLTRK